MADSAKRLVGPLQLSTSTSVLYTVPAATTTIVRSIHVVNATAGVAQVSLGVNTSASTAAGAFFFGQYVPTNGVLDWSGFLVLAAGETLQGLSSAATSLTVVVCGIEVA